MVPELQVLRRVRVVGRSPEHMARLQPSSRSSFRLNQVPDAFMYLLARCLAKPLMSRGKLYDVFAVFHA